MAGSKKKKRIEKQKEINRSYRINKKEETIPMKDLEKNINGLLLESFETMKLEKLEDGLEREWGFLNISKRVS